MQYIHNILALISRVSQLPHQEHPLVIVKKTWRIDSDILKDRPPAPSVITVYGRKLERQKHRSQSH